MKKILALTLLLLPLFALPSCSTTHAARYAYGKTSVYADSSTPAYSKAIWGIPLLLFSVAFDIVTLPGQAAFGVWPYWGDKAQSMKPSEEFRDSMDY